MVLRGGKRNPSLLDLKKKIKADNISVKKKKTENSFYSESPDAFLIFSKQTTKLFFCIVEISLETEDLLKFDSFEACIRTKWPLLAG